MIAGVLRAAAVLSSVFLTLGKGNRQSLVAYSVGYVFGAIKKIANRCFALHSCHTILFFSEIL